MARNRAHYNITIIGYDNTSLQICAGKQISDSLDPIKNSFKNCYKNESIYIGLIHCFFTKKIEELDELIADTKWKDKKDDVYHEKERKFGNFIGVLYKEFDIGKKEIIQAANEEYKKPDVTIKIKLTLQIVSRFDNPQKPYFLQTLLLKGRNIGFSKQEVLANDEGYFDFLLMAIFRKSFIFASNKGYYKAYHNFLENNSRFKGTIDFSRHIRTNIGLKNGNIAYSYRENSIINYMNMIILEAFECLQRKYVDLVRNFLELDSEFMNRIQYIKYSISNYMCDIQEVIANNLTPISHPYYFEYEALREICLKILRNEGMGYEDDNNSAQGILYYIPDLWEEYLFDILNSQEYKLKEQCDIKVFSYNDNSFKQTIKPDFVFFDRKQNEDTIVPFMILDAKFKREWWKRICDKSSLGEVNGMSLLPDYDECIRNMNNFNANATGVVFPVSEKTEDKPNIIQEYKNNYKEKSTHKISEYNIRDRFYTFPIFIPEVENKKSYDEWMKSFEDSNSNIKKTIVDIINEEKKRKRN